MTAYITKYALSSGIKEVDDARESKTCARMISVPSMGTCATFLGQDWHTDKQSAIARAEEMRDAKLQSLQKQIDRVRRLDFNK